MAICSWESSVAALYWFLRQFHLHMWTLPSLRSVQGPTCHSCSNFRYARHRQLNAFRGTCDLELKSVFCSKQFLWAENKSDVLSVACVAKEMCYYTALAIKVRKGIVPWSSYCYHSIKGWGRQKHENPISHPISCDYCLVNVSPFAPGTFD